ncbi:MAG: hypothetical protein K1W19_03525 [Lachnospiraceae bacterium]
MVKVINPNKVEPKQRKKDNTSPEKYHVLSTYNIRDRNIGKTSKISKKVVRIIAARNLLLKTARLIQDFIKEKVFFILAAFLFI